MTDSSSQGQQPGKKLWVAVLICFFLICAAAAALLLPPLLLQDRHTYEQACGLLSEGEYAAARELFAALDYADSAEKLRECDYSQATTLLEAGDYEAGKAAFLALGDYKDSAGQCLRCDYLRAQALMDGGDYAPAAELFLSLGGYEDSASQAALCRDSLYASAKQSMINADFEAAAASFRLLGDHKDSALQLGNCEERMAAEAAFTGNRLITKQHIVENFDHGTLYGNSLGYIFVPHEVNADTAWLVYFPGGCGTGENLSVPCIYMEHNKFDPNAVMIYLFNNGWDDMRSFILTLAELMKQVALECGTWFHDVVTVGSSNGCYPAMIASPVLYDRVGITVDAVIAFDPGSEWDVADFALLTAEEADSMAEAGTRVYLLEQHDFSDYAMTVEPVAELVRHGADIIVVECNNDGHNHIGPDAIRAGFYDWVLGQKEGLEPGGITGLLYVIRMIKLYPDGSQESLEVPYLPENTK